MWETRLLSDASAIRPLMTAGWRVIRLTSRQFGEPAELAAELTTLLAPRIDPE